MRPITIVKALTTADDDNIAASQTPLGAGNLTLNGVAVTGGVAILDTPRRVLLTFAGNETGHSFVVTGNQRVDGTGNVISETIAGTTAGTVQSTLDYGQVTAISISTAATAAIKAGTNGVGSSPWFLVNYNAQPVNLSVAVTVSGTVNYTVQYTYDDFLTTTTAPTAFNDPLMTAKTAAADATINDPVTGVRLLVNSGTGTATMKYIQAGIKG